LQDALSGEAATTLTRTAQHPPATSATAGHVILLPGRPVAAPPAGPRPGRGRARAYKAVMAAVAASMVNAGLAGFLLTGTTGAGSQARPRAPAPAGIISGRTPVRVNAGSLAGQQAGTVIRRLRQLGLHPRVQWDQESRQEPGTIVSVRPTGLLRPGAIVIITAAFQPPGRVDGDTGPGSSRS
jgi:hypothetical protein